MDEAPPAEINLPYVAAELQAVSDAYEDALVRHDMRLLDEMFWYHPQTVRYGVAENLYCGEAIRQYRLACKPVHPGGHICNTVITSFGEGFGTVSAEFTAPDTDKVGRQLH